MSIDVPQEVKDNAKNTNNSNPLLLFLKENPEESCEYPCMCCRDFKGAFSQYLMGQLCSDSPYIGVRVNVKVGDSKPVWLRMESRGIPKDLTLPEDYTISNLRGLELPEIEYH